MTRGDQRERARAKNQADAAKKATKLTGNPQARKEADMKAMADKAAAKKAAAEAIANGTAPPPEDKKKKANTGAQQKK